MQAVNPYVPLETEVVERVQEARDIFTLRLRFRDPAQQASYRFQPGQFNMLYLYGVGEVPISIASDPEDGELLGHTIRVVGRVTEGLARLAPGARLGLRGPFGRGWPMPLAAGRDVVVVTGGLGCAPVVSAIHYILKRRARFGRLSILQGVKHADDLIFRERYARWAQAPDTRVFLTADEGGPLWPGHVGLVTSLFDRLELDPARTLAMMCGPEPMMRAAARSLAQRGLDEAMLYLSLERNMQCALGHCGHCQYGGRFVCKDGPVFTYAEVKALFGVKGF